MSASVNEAIGNAGKAAQIVDMNASAASRETTATPLRITKKEMQAAAILMPLTQIEVSTLALPDLRDSLRFAISQDGRAAQYVFARLLPARLDNGADQSTDGAVRRSVGDKRVINEIRYMITTVSVRLKDRSLLDLNQRAQEPVSERANSDRVSNHGIG